MTHRDQVAAFEQTAGPYLAAAWNLARWLVRNDDDAQDLVQEAYLKAFRFFGGFNGVNAKAWLLTIVRNTCYSWLKEQRGHAVVDDSALAATPADDAGPDVLVLRAESGRLIDDALSRLPVEYREAFVLREIEGLSYREIADVAAIPIGTVMSRLSRARQELQQALGPKLRKEARA